MKNIICIAISLFMTFTMCIPQVAFAQESEGDVLVNEQTENPIDDQNQDGEPTDGEDDQQDEDQTDGDDEEDVVVTNVNVKTKVKGLAAKNEHLIYSNTLIKDKITVTNGAGRNVYLDKYVKGKWKVQKKYKAAKGNKSKKLTIVFPKKKSVVKYRVRIPAKTVETVTTNGDTKVIKKVKYKGTSKITKTVAKTFRWPIKGHRRISSGFGGRHCPFHGREFHPAVDIPARSGTKVMASADGVVEKAGRVRSFGKRIIIRHGNKRTVTWYNHLSSIKVKKGQKVKAGQVIGRVGSTGDSTGPHLDFRIYINGKAKNPRKYAK